MRTGPFPVVERLSPSQAVTLLQSSDDLETALRRHCQCFMFGYPWMPVKVTKDNVKLAAFLGDVFITRDPSGHLAAVSLQSCTPCLRGVRVDVSYYGKDIVDFLYHAQGQLQRVLAATRAEQYNIMLHLPLGLEIEWLEAFLQRFLGPIHVPNGDFKNVLILSAPASKI